MCSRQAGLAGGGEAALRARGLCQLDRWLVWNRKNSRTNTLQLLELKRKGGVAIEGCFSGYRSGGCRGSLRPAHLREGRAGIHPEWENCRASLDPEGVMEIQGSPDPGRWLHGAHCRRQEGEVQAGTVENTGLSSHQVPPGLERGAARNQTWHLLQHVPSLLGKEHLEGAVRSWKEGFLNLSMAGPPCQATQQ